MKFVKSPCEWNGKKYESIAAAAFEQGITVPSMWNRLKRGYTCDADMPATRAVACEWNGVQYKTIKASADANHIGKVGMHYRIRMGYKCDSDMQR